MSSGSSNQRTVQFFLSSLWSWLPEGRKRILEALESCDLVSISSTMGPENHGCNSAEAMKTGFAILTQVQEQAHFSWDEKYDWFHIRCLEDDKDYVMNEYLKAQNEMENELREGDVIQADGNLIPTVTNDLIDTSRPRVAVPDESDEPEVAARETERVSPTKVNGQGRVGKRTGGKAVGRNTAYLF